MLSWDLHTTNFPVLCFFCFGRVTGLFFRSAKKQGGHKTQQHPNWSTDSHDPSGPTLLSTRVLAPLASSSIPCIAVHAPWEAPIVGDIIMVPEPSLCGEAPNTLGHRRQHPIL